MSSFEQRHALAHGAVQEALGAGEDTSKFAERRVLSLPKLRTVDRDEENVQAT